MKIFFESADLIGSPEGYQFNYCWRNHGTLEVPDNASDSTITRKVKKALSLSGRHTPLWDCGDDKAFRLQNTLIGFNWNVDYSG